MGVDAGKSVAQKAQGMSPEHHLPSSPSSSSSSGWNAQWLWSRPMSGNVWFRLIIKRAEMMVWALLPWHILRLNPNRCSPASRAGY